MSDSVLLEIYRRLYQRYGPQRWWPGESSFEVILGAILTQAAAWANVEMALSNLKDAGCFSLEALRDVPEHELAALIRPSGYFNAKARKLKAFVNHIWDNYDGNLEAFLFRGTQAGGTHAEEVQALRRELLSIYGIGEETADDILVYAARKPSFVIDAYTRRILGRLGLAPGRETYQAYQELFHRALSGYSPPEDMPHYNEYHALLDRHGKETCKKRPLCQDCCLLELCSTGKASVQP